MGNVLKAKGTVSSCPVPGSVRTFRKFYVGLKLSLALSVVSSGTGGCRAVSARSGEDGKGGTGSQHRWEGREVALQWHRDGSSTGSRLWALGAGRCPEQCPTALGRSQCCDPCPGQCPMLGAVPHSRVCPIPKSTPHALSPCSARCCAQCPVPGQCLVLCPGTGSISVQSQFSPGVIPVQSQFNLRMIPVLCPVPGVIPV